MVCENISAKNSFGKIYRGLFISGFCKNNWFKVFNGVEYPSLRTRSLCNDGRTTLAINLFRITLPSIADRNSRA